MNDIDRALATTAEVAKRAGVTRDEMTALLCEMRDSFRVAFPTHLRAHFAIAIWCSLPWYKRLWYWLVG